VRGADEEPAGLGHAGALPAGDNRPGAAVAQRGAVAEHPADHVGSDGVLVGDPTEHLDVPMRELHTSPRLVLLAFFITPAPPNLA
jgi:hypothetical protein